MTDVSNACRTMMMDLKSCSWDDSAIHALGLRGVKGALPQIVSSAEPIGQINDGGE